MHPANDAVGSEAESIGVALRTTVIEPIVLRVPEWQRARNDERREV